MRGRPLQRAVLDVVRHGRSALLAAALLLSVAGCGGAALNRTFTDYTAVHADMSNRQLLMNLARMANTHPPHFLQLGLINTTFTFGATSNANVGQTFTDGRDLTGNGPLRLLSRVLTWGVTLGGVLNEQPTFSLAPLSGPHFASGFLAAVPPPVFFSLFGQGEPIDQLLRAVVQTVEYTDTCGRRVIVHNTPSVDHPDSYGKFLRLAGIAIELQRNEVLRTVTTTTTVAAPSPHFDAPSLDNAVRLAEKGFTLVEVPDKPGKYAIGTSVTNTTLDVMRTEKSQKVWQRIVAQPYFKVDPDSEPC